MQVRRQAQNALSSCVDSYLYAGRKLLPDIVPFLKSDDGILHEQFKVIIIPFFGQLGLSESHRFCTYVYPPSA